MFSWLTIIDYAGTFAFALSGATVAMRRELDLFGVLVVSFAAATAGGIARDVLIGATPPVALVNGHYLLIASAAGVFTFVRADLVERLSNPVQVFDSAGLGLFVVAGTAKALAVGLTPTSAVLLGMLSGIGGGIARDVLTARVPVVLKSDLYASAALAGGAVVAIANAVSLPRAPAMFTGAALCFVLRYMAIRYGWHLPVARTSSNDSPD
ncbi:MAG: trimeric intracellular cation channel family protein [Pseudomonadota bacterium]